MNEHAMQIMPPNRSQLVPPRISSTLHRERLKPLGLAMLEHRVSTVIGPAGCGKSVWLASLTEEAGWPATAWISIDGNETEPAIFISQLIYAMRIIFAKFGNEALKTIKSLENTRNNWPTTMAAFVNAIPTHTETVIVVDDFHFVHSQSIICSILEYLVKWMPGNMHLVITGRYELPLKLSRLRINGEVLDIDIQQLMFTRAEAGELLALMDIHTSDDTLASIYDMTEGWPVGLRLTAVVMKQMGQQALWPDQSARRVDQALHEYLGQELLGSIPAQLKEFLLSVALLPYIDAGICDAALETGDSAEKISRLQADGLLAKITGTATRWRLHHLIKEYLQDEAHMEIDTQVVKQIRQRACDYLEDKGDIELALDIACSDAEWSRAAFLIHSHGYDYYSGQGCLDLLYKWVARLPDEMIREDPWLLFLKGRSLLQIDNQEAVSMLVAAADQANQNGDLRCEAFCLLSLNHAQIQTGDSSYSEIILSRMMSHPALQSDSLSYGAALSVALGNAVYDDNIRAGRLICRQALKLKLDAEVRMSVYYGAAIIAHRSGQLDRALHFCREAMEMPIVKANERLAVSGFLIESTVLNLKGDWSTSEAVCQKALEICLKHGMIADASRIHRNLARIKMRQGRLAESQAEYELACAGFSDSASDSYLTYVSGEIAALRLLSGESPGDLLNEARDLVTELKAFPVGQGGDRNTECILARIAMQAGEMDEARAILEGLMKHHHQNGSMYQWTGTGLILAYVLWLQGYDRQCDRLLRRALGLAQANNWQNFWEWYDPAIYAMYRRAAEMNIHAEWAWQNLLRWFPQDIEEDAGQYLTSSNEHLRVMTSKFLQERSGPTIIHACYFKGFRVFINGSEVESTSWTTQKAESLLKILLYERRLHNKDAVIELLWPDIRLGDASLRMALSQIRKVLRAHGATQNCLSVRRRSIALDPSVVVYTDCDGFESSARQALDNVQANLNHRIRQLQSAAARYHGPLLPEDELLLHAEGENRYLHERYLTILKTLAELTTKAGNMHAALDFCTKYLKIEPADEEVTRMAMELAWKNGRKSKALNLYHGLVRVLEEEYSVLPEERTTDLFQRIIS